jgi:hypothetical protein
MDWDQVLCALIKLRENEAWFANRYRGMEWVGERHVHPSIHHGRNAAALHQAVEAVRFQQLLQRAHDEAMERLGAKVVGMVA